MKIIKINPSKPSKKTIAEAVKTMQLGGLVVYPTDTCYGLGADITNPVAIAKIYKMKGRNPNKPLSMIIKNFSEIENMIEIDKKRKKFILSYLPGPVTFILLNTDYKFLRQNTIGLRIPDYKITKLISELANFPYTTTSANISGKDVCYTTKDIIEQFKDRVIQPDLILDGGDLSDNVPSTVIDIIKWPPKILRQGSLEIKLSK